jgi:hypothetical protein
VLLPGSSSRGGQQPSQPLALGAAWVGRFKGRCAGAGHQQLPAGAAAPAVGVAVGAPKAAAAARWKPLAGAGAPGAEQQRSMVVALRQVVDRQQQGVPAGSGERGPGLGWLQGCGAAIKVHTQRLQLHTLHGDMCQEREQQRQEQVRTIRQ